MKAMCTNVYWAGQQYPGYEYGFSFALDGQTNNAPHGGQFNVFGSTPDLFNVGEVYDINVTVVVPE